MSTSSAADTEEKAPWPGQKAVKTILKYRVWQVLPTPCAVIFNRVLVRKPAEMPDLPLDEWALTERRALLTDSQGRLAGLEGKGPGLATITAVVVAGSALALATGWNESTAIGRALLFIAAVFTFLSLLTPIYLVGPLKHPCITAADVKYAAEQEQPERAIAELAANAAMASDMQNQRIANLLDAARRELYYSITLLVVWLALVPLTGTLRRYPPHILLTAQSSAEPGAHALGTQ